MEQEFARQLDEWTAYFALTGGAAATLLGLLFVAMSLRLDIFHRRGAADIRLFAAFNLITFLLAGSIAALALAPHEDVSRFAVSLLAIAMIGIVTQWQVIRNWRRLSPARLAGSPGSRPDEWQGWTYMIGMAAAQIGLALAGVLVLRGHPDALGLVAVVSALLLGLGTMAAWLLLSHARPDVPSSDEAQAQASELHSTTLGKT